MAQVRLSRELMSEDHTEDQPDMISLRQREVELPKSQSEARQQVIDECIERVRTEGEWFPEGTTLSEWRDIKNKVAKLIGSFGVSDATFENHPPKLDLEVIDWDVRVMFSFTKEGDDWVLTNTPRY